jgi:hypothetical protein
MSILAPNDFTGRYAITQHPTNATKIQSYIDMIEPSIMNELFGVELLSLYTQGIIDEEEIYTKLLNPFFENLSCGKLIESKGIIDMLKGFVYFAYSAEDYSEVSVNGNVVQNNENSTKANDIESSLYTKYNTSVKTYKAIQAYILENQDVYPTFKGQRKSLLNWF